MKVPFNRPVQLPEHERCLAEALASGHLSGVGPLTRKVEARLQQLGLARTLLCSSGTHALEMAALLCGLQTGDEVILPSYTFVSTANAFALRGAALRFGDNDGFGNLTLAEIERLYTSRTKVVVVVHYAGASADMQALKAWCDARHLVLIEDAAQAIAAECRGQPLGTFGRAAAFSFHETKNVSAGEGGGLRLADAAWHERAEIIREKGTNRTQFFLGLADKYTWLELGSSYVMSELNVAYLAPQLERLDEIQGRRRALWQRYEAALAAPLAALGGEVLLTPQYNRPNHHMFAIVWSHASQRARFIAHMRAHDITAPFHYQPLHKSPFGRSWAAQHGGWVEDLPQCERLADCLVRLPLYFNLSDAEQDYVIETALRFVEPTT